MRPAWPVPAKDRDRGGWQAAGCRLVRRRRGTPYFIGRRRTDMNNDANIDLAGFVASEPSFRRLASGTSQAKLRVAYTERRFNRETGEWGDGPTSFVNVVCWRTLADNVAVCLRKGEPVLVRGRMRIRDFEGKDGSPRSITEVEASSIGHDLSRGVAHFSRTRRAAGETAAESAEALAAAASRDGEEPAGGDEPGPPGGPAGDGAGGNGARDGYGAGGSGARDGYGAGGSGPDGNGAPASGAAAGGVLDEDAVAEFASEMSESLGETPA
jgi:single-strand DNA-binding protein